MKKSILGFGVALSTTEQRSVNGGSISCNYPFSYPVSNCSQCVNTILPGAPTFCFNNCCIMAT